MHLKSSDRHIVLALTALVGVCISTQAEAGSVALTQSDLAMAIYASANTSTPLDSASLAGFFGQHRCLCPDTLTLQVQLTDSGKTNLGNSTVGVTFYLGQNCQASPSSCTSLGQVSFSASQSAPSPSFSSNLVFQTVEGTTALACTALTGGTTTVWAVLTQDGLPLSFPLSLDLPVVTTSVGAPTGVNAQPGNQNLLIHWSAPSNATLVAAYQVLCLPRPSTAQTAGYESCGLPSGDVTTIDPADQTQLCSAKLSASTTSFRLTGLTNGTAYTVGIIAIDPSGGISPVSALATAAPQPTEGFWERYKDGGGAATGCSMVPASRSSHESGWLLLLLGACLWLTLRRRARMGALVAVLLIAAATTAVAQDDLHKETDEWARAEWSAPRGMAAPEWAIEVGVSWYRPAIDGEFSNAYHPFADTFSGSRHPLWEAELDRYLIHGWGTLGVGLRSGYYRVTANALLANGGRSGDETALRLIPFSPSLIYRVNRPFGLDRAPLIPYAKLGLDATYWQVTNTGGNTESGVSLGWHAAAGVMLGLAWLGNEATNPEGLADPCALFFEWDYAAINGLGLQKTLHVGDNIWFAGLMFDL